MSIKSRLRNWLMETKREEPSLSLDVIVSRYEASLSVLEDGADGADLLSVLVQRDHVATALEKEAAPPAIVQRLVDLDRRLRRIAPRNPDSDWDAWRQALNPFPDRWWWRLDEKSDLPLVILASLFMIITLSLAVEIIQRMWGGGLDQLAVVSMVLTLALTGSPLTKRGRELAGWLMDKVSLSTRYRGETMMGMAVLALLVTLILRLTLPTLAVYFNNRGYVLLQTSDLPRAQRSFQRAVSINPDYAAAYYNLADAYVEIADYKQAVSLYTKVLVLDQTFDLAYIGLGYVFILQGEPERAIPILYTGLSLAQDDVARAALWANLGGAYLEAKRYHEAEAALGQALRLAPEEAAAHCNLALTAKAMAYPEDEVTLHWENCLRYADPTTPRGQELAAMARAHLQQLERRRW